MGGIDEEDRSPLIRDLADRRPVDDLGIRRVSPDDHLGPVFERNGPQLVEVDRLGVGVDAVADDVEEIAGEVHRRSVGEVTSLIQRHTEDRVPRLEDGEVRGEGRL